MVAALILAATVLGFPATAQQPDWQRAQQNYMAIVRGAKKFEQLTPTEQGEVRLLLRAMRRSPPQSASDDCRYAWDRAESAASDLENYARRLVRCAEGRDFNDDCSSELRRARNAQSDYESATSDVRSYCN